MAGRALDLQAASGSGVDAVHVYGYAGSCGGASTFLGVATYGFARPDVGAAFGNQFTNSGYTLSVSGLADGTWCLVPFAHSTVSGRFTSPQTVTVHVNVHLPGVTFDPAAGTYPQAVAVTISPTSPLPAGAVVSYSTDGGATWADYDGTPVAIATSGTTLRAYAHLDGAVDGDTTVGTYTFEAWTVRYYHVDALGSVRLVTDQNGAVVERHDFLPFGDETLAMPPTGTPTFTGQERDVETKLDYFGARYLLPLTGRFTTPDPLKTGDALTNPQMWNRYAYVANNPATFVDPSGMEICPPNITDPDEAARNDCKVDPLLMDPTAPFLQFFSGHFDYGSGDGGGVKAAYNTVKQKACSGIPSGRTVGASGGIGGIVSGGGGGEVVLNYDSGQVSAFGFAGAQAGWNGGIAGSVYVGFVYGLNRSSSNYSGGFTGINVGAGAGFFLASSSGGLTSGVSGLVPNGAVRAGGLSRTMKK